MGDLKLVFGSAIKSKRSELGLSQEELAERAGLHRTYISDVERGARNPSLESIEKLAGALELSVAGLFARTASRSSSTEPVEILLIEDNPQDVEMTCRAFQKAGIANPVRVVTDGAAAVDFLFGRGSGSVRRDRLPGVILLDLNLPNISGLEILRRIKEDRRTQAIPVVVLTVSDEDADIAACRELEASGYIVKPVGFRNFSEITPHIHMEWILANQTSGLGPEVLRR